MFQLRTSLRGSTCACVALSQVSCSIWATTNAAPSVSSTTSERHQTKASDGQRVSESGERAEVEIFTTDVGVEREGRERLRDPFARKLQREGERVGERLAAVRERAADDLFEAPAVAHRGGRRLAAVQHDHAGDDAG